MPGRVAYRPPPAVRVSLQSRPPATPPRRNPARNQVSEP
jgi:hypothetical protein